MLVLLCLFVLVCFWFMVVWYVFGVEVFVFYVCAYGFCLLFLGVVENEQKIVEEAG